MAGRFDHICTKCQLPLRWDTGRLKLVTASGEVMCTAGGWHEGVRR